jgi:Tfp pilus assembly protein PilO
MKHGIRNSLILAATLIIMIAGGWFLLDYVYSPQIEELEQRQAQREREYNSYAETAAMYEETLLELNRQYYIRDNHPKELFHNHRSGRVYDYIRQLNEGISFTNFNYSIRDSSSHGEYGVVTVSLRGEGEYRNLNNFVHRIEHSSAIMHIASLQITNITELGRLSRVAFEMTLQLYYNRDDRLEWQPRMYMADAMGNIGHNPFFPLIHPVPPNTRNLVDVDQSRLVGITSQFILLRDQGGNLKRLTVGSEVYLGTLQRIDTERQEAIFHLNRGGIFDRVRMALD